MRYLIYKFELTTIFEHWSNEKIIVAETESKTSYLYWQQFRIKFITMSMAEFMKFVKCENEGVFDIKRMYSAEQAFKKMQNYCNLHFAYMGMRVIRSLGTGKLICSFCSREKLKSTTVIIFGKLLITMMRAMWSEATRRGICGIRKKD
ncbi:hypothetical protein A6279_12235 [Bacillus wiedmannii]|nr:hypothetical protein AT260_17375 [Bacillus wiedmannii]OAK00965.1 hypothetical protein A6279_12235 [Bacillus wiedmannii]OAK12180.1 hypothetical protein A6278_23415 [Bacillus wiedmannii]OAK18363.1 hypothetical protein A6281_06510 [Bacillus wiedmannii]OAK21630.1 hypothetical protein A6282_04815 [Bacillus wiedmannii]